jgi:glucose-1-phosphate thymidylyltransferase
LKAIIPAAGIGSRLRPQTHTAPKALLHVAGKPILGHILDEVKAYGIRDVVIIVGFMGDKIIDYVNKNCNIKATFVTQEELKGLGWAIYLTREQIREEPVLIILGDTIFESDLGKVLGGDHDSIGTKTVDDPRRFGIAETDGLYVTALTEKPEKPTSNLALVGIYYIKSTGLFRNCLEEMVSKEITTKGEYQLTDALQLMIRHGCKMTTFNVDGWFDCGKPDALLATNRYLLSQIKSIDQRDGNVLLPPVFISKTAVLENSVVGPFVSVGDDSKIIRSIVRDSIISEGAEVVDSMLDSSLVGNNALLTGHYKRVNIGDSSEIGY